MLVLTHELMSREIQITTLKRIHFSQISTGASSMFPHRTNGGHLPISDYLTSNITQTRKKAPKKSLYSQREQQKNPMSHCQVLW